MCSEVTVIVKNDEKNLRNKYFSYDAITVSEADPFIAQCLEATIKEFGAEPEDVVVKISMVVK